MAAIDLQDLMRRPSADVANLVATSLLDFNVEPGALRSGRAGRALLQQLLVQVKDLAPEEKGALIKKAVEGMSALKPQKQAQLIRMGVKLLKISFSSDQEGNLAAGTAPPSPEVQRLTQLASEAFQDMLESDFKQVEQVAQQTFMTTALNPSKLVMIAKELPPEVREDLKEILNEKNIVSEQHKTLVGRLLEPNGPLDRLGVVLGVLEKLKPFAMYLLAVSMIECLLGLLYILLWGDSPFANWLVHDGFGMVVTIAAFFGLFHFAESLKAIVIEIMSESHGSDVESLISHPSLTQEKKGVIALCILFLIIGILGVVSQVFRAVWGVLLLLDFPGIAMVVKAIFLLGPIYQIAISLEQLFGALHASPSRRRGNLTSPRRPQANSPSRRLQGTSPSRRLQMDSARRLQATTPSPVPSRVTDFSGRLQTTPPSSIHSRTSDFAGRHQATPNSSSSSRSGEVPRRPKTTPTTPTSTAPSRSSEVARRNQTTPPTPSTLRPIFQAAESEDSDDSDDSDESSE